MEDDLPSFLDSDVSENSGFSSPNHPVFHGVFHYFHHPFWGTTIFGNTQDAYKIGPQFSGLMPSEIMDSASRNIEFWVPQRLWETSTKGGMDIPKKGVHPDRWKPVIQDGDVFFSPIPKMGERII